MLLVKTNGWAEGSTEKIALHAFVGGLMSSLGGGDVLAGATGGGFNEAIQGELSKIQDPALHQWASVFVGAAAANTVGGDAQTGGSTAASGTKNNNYAVGLDNPLPYLVTGLLGLSALPMLVLLSSLSKSGDPGSSVELLNPDGSVKQRRSYKENGEPDVDVDYNHTDDGTHTFPHQHRWGPDGRGDPEPYEE